MDDFIQGYEQDEFLNETNILTLDNEVDTPGMTESGSMTDDLNTYHYQHYDYEDQQGTVSDDDDDMAMGQEELSLGGVFNEEAVGHHLSNLGRAADGTQHVFLHLSLPGLSLRDISILNDYIHLQKVEVPYNELSDISVFSHMPYLLELDASHNQISKMLDFTAPRNLKCVDLSFNVITEMSDLSAHHYLTKLVLDNNQITKITGLSSCHRLTHLSVAHNKLREISGLDNLPVKNLNLSGNQLKKIENLGSLQYLQVVNMSGNQIRSLRGLEGHDFLETIDMEDNEIIDLSEIQYIAQLHLIRDLNIQRNPLRELPDYRLSVLFQIQKLNVLDRRRVDVDEKMAANNMFNPPMAVIAARDHIMHVVYSFLQPSRILDSTLPSVETPYPMLVLVGPQGAGKKDLAMKLVDEFPDYFGYGISHTTRKPHSEEEDGKDYHFVDLDQFETEVKMGKFIQTYSYHGNLYGLTIESIESVARDGLACVVHMELEGVLTLKNTYFEPRYVLIMPLSRDSHERRLQERGVYSESQIEWTLNRADIYAERNREHPGFFDMFINSEKPKDDNKREIIGVIYHDEITDAYRRLRRLVMDYLGISVPSPEQSDALDQSQTGSQYLEKEATCDTFGSTGGAGGMGARTWSKPSLADNTSQGMTNVLSMTMSPMPSAGRGVVEEESLRRRQSAAKEAVSGTRPSLYEQILQKAPRTVPQPVSAQLGLGDENLAARSLSAPPQGLDNMDALPPSSPDSSDANSEASSGLTNISEARDMDRGGSPVASFEDGIAGDNLPDTVVDPLELMSGSNSKSMSGGPLAPRLGSQSGSRPESGVMSPNRSQAMSPTGSETCRSNGRPGSSRHAILPPIGQTHKMHAPEY